MDIKRVLELLPHRYPFLLVDRVLECEPGTRLVGVKNVTFNEPHFTGHFPERKIMPGVLIIEALAQATGLLGFRTMGDEPRDDVLYMLVGVDNVRFKRQVIPGDQLKLEVVLERPGKVVWKFSCKATVDGELVTSCNMLCAAKPKEEL